MMNETKSCAEMLADLEWDWNRLWDGRQAYRMYKMVRMGCQEVKPYLLRHLENENPEFRWRALHGLADLKCRECRPIFIKMHLTDPNEDVRRIALTTLSSVFDGERDREVLQLALAAYDDPKSSVAMRLAAGAMMMYQLDISDETGGPGWWNEDPEDLLYPTLLRAVEETRKLLGPKTLA